jgi:hypothetical protein
VGAGGEDEAVWFEGDSGAGDDGGDFVGGEGAPDGGGLDDVDAGGLDGFAEFLALAELAVGGWVGVARGEGLVELAAGLGALVEDDDLGAGLGGGERGGQAGGAGADDEDVAGALGGVVPGGVGGLREEVGGEGAGDMRPLPCLLDAGAAADMAVDGHDAIETGAHAAVQASWGAGWGLAVGEDAGGGEGGGDGFAVQGDDFLAIEVEGEPVDRRPDGIMGQAHASSLIGCGG